MARAHPDGLQHVGIGDAGAHGELVKVGGWFGLAAAARGYDGMTRRGPAYQPTARWRAAVLAATLHRDGPV
jgi:hypothetical protein